MNTDEAIRNQALQITQLERELLELRKSKPHGNGEDIAGLRETIHALHGKIFRLDREKESLLEQGLRREQSMAEQERQDMRLREELEQENMRLREELEQMKNSKSWRMTAPMRRLIWRFASRE